MLVTLRNDRLGTSHRLQVRNPERQKIGTRTLMRCWAALNPGCVRPYGWLGEHGPQAAPGWRFRVVVDDDGDVCIMGRQVPLRPEEMAPKRANGACAAKVAEIVAAAPSILRRLPAEFRARDFARAVRESGIPAASEAIGPALKKLYSRRGPVRRVQEAAGRRPDIFQKRSSE